MAANGGDKDSVGEAKSLPFGAVLRRAIKEEFGTGKEFAAKLGISEGRVSQLMSGAESLTAQTLDDILRSFTGLSHQEKLHGAWVSTFAPPPLASLENREAEAGAHRLLEARERLAANGRARDSLNALVALRPRIEDAELRRAMQLAATELSLFLGRSAQARRFARELTEQAKEAGEMLWIARGLWLQANVARTTPEASAREMAGAQDTASAFASAWNPSDPQTRALAKEIRGGLLRDRALTLLALSERKPVPKEHLSQALRDLENHILAGDLRADTRAVFLEVKGRVLLAQGNTLATEDVVEEASLIREFVSPDHEIKAAILSGQLLVRRGHRDQAEPILLNALDACYEVDNQHHARTLERMLAQLDPSYEQSSDARVF